MELKVFSASSHKELTKEICKELAISEGRVDIIKFANENLFVKILDNVRGKDVFVIQTATPPVNEGIIELLIFIDALKHASASRITAVIPYFPYARSDKKDQPRISITARLIADLLETAGTNRVLTMDLHSPQVQGFFRIPVDQLKAAPAICDYLKLHDLKNSVLIAGDAGEAKDVGGYANRLNLPMAIIDKRRFGNDDKPKAVNIIGDVYGKNAIIIDDEVATGRTLIEASEFLIKNGASDIMAACVHPVLCGNAKELLLKSDIQKLVVTDTIPIPDEKKLPKLKVLSVASLFANAIKRVHEGESVSELFE